MKVGDLVVCITVEGRPSRHVRRVGLIVERYETSHMFNVLISGLNLTAAFQVHQLEVINESR